MKAKGEAYEEVAQKFTYVELDVDAYGQSAFDVQNSAATNTRQILDFLEGQGDKVMRIQNTGASLQPDFEYINGTRTFKQYKGTARVSFEIEEVNGGVLDGIMDIGGSMVNTINQKESYEDLVAAQQTALKNAVYNTRVNAEKMLSGVGETLGKALTVESNAGNQLQSGGGSLQVLRAEATVTYEIIG